LSKQSGDSPAAALSRILGPLRRAVLRATRTAEALPDLPEAHIEILRAVVDQPGMSPPAIAEHLKLARPTVSNLMKTMRRADLIELTRDEDDARRVYVSATRTAKGLLRRYDAASEDILTTALSTLSPAERKAIEAAIPALSKLQSIVAAPRD
jgi:DNA-binding MarR family transcriptional regulator